MNDHFGEANLDHEPSTVPQCVKSCVEMYTCSNTALGRKRKKNGFVFLYLKPPRFFLLHLFSSKHVRLIIRIERCSPVR